MKELFGFFGGRKNATVWIAIIAMSVLTGFGKVEVGKFIETLTWLVGLGVGSIALEDGLSSFGKKK
tara:strand:- start:105 stop:302 length:198 start_codon:yes stop_codon:yes gene_type:complete